MFFQKPEIGTLATKCMLSRMKFRETKSQEDCKRQNSRTFIIAVSFGEQQNNWIEFANVPFFKKLDFFPYMWNLATIANF